MENWFTVEKIDNETFAISEYKHWEETHCYLLLGTNQAILIDTGLGVSNIKAVVESITNLPIIVLTTHTHWDHIGGHKYFTTFAVHELEKDWIANNFPIPLQVVKNNLTYKPCDFPNGFKIDDYEIFNGTPQIILHDSDSFDIGNRLLKVVHTPGHSPGHCCFYDEDRQYLFSGDLIYKGCLDAFYPTTNPKQFMQSVEKIKGFKIKKILPAHHDLDLELNLIESISNAFNYLNSINKLNQGEGIFNFGNFSIHI
jgi:glyoxylase-like metal-dependent hydrolase (beta-lactamase superfamily II)